MLTKEKTQIIIYQYIKSIIYQVELGALTLLSEYQRLMEAQTGR